MVLKIMFQLYTLIKFKLLGSQNWDGKVKSSRCKTRKSWGGKRT